MEQENEFLRIRQILSIRYPVFASQIASTKFEYSTDLPSHTAATDGATIYFDPEYFKSLDDEEKLFVVAHEMLHIKFEHMRRLKTPSGKLRDMKLWNIATDAIINANLEQDGFKIKKGYVNMPEAINYSAEAFYEKLLSEQQAKQNPKNNADKGKQGSFGSASGGANGGVGDSAIDADSSEAKQAGDDAEPYDKNVTDCHDLWEKALGKDAQADSERKSIIQKIKEHYHGNQDQMPSPVEIDESAMFRENREARRANAREYMHSYSMGGGEINLEPFGKVEAAEPVVDWKWALKKAFETDEYEAVWTRRKAIAENNYAYRLDEEKEEEVPETEVMLDISGSISAEQLKSFLQQLKPLLENSKLKVGFFASEATKSFVEIKSNKDIDNLQIPKLRNGTNLDVAVRSFSKGKIVNKIVFTDGYGYMPRDDLRSVVDLIWILSDKHNFSPCCGRVIFMEHGPQEREWDSLSK